MKFKNFREASLIILALFNALSVCNGAVMNKNNNKHGAHEHLSKERESDGAYSPKERHHQNLVDDHQNDFDHEAILGSHKEAEEYDHLPPEEAKKRLAVLLTKMDLNKDRNIDRAELKAWIMRSFRMLSEEEALEKLEDADENHDGKISWVEYLSDTYGVNSENDFSFESHEENLHLISEDKEMWNAADQDGDGLLDSGEWQLFSNPEDHPEMIPIVLKQSLKSKDTDNDGSISFQEFIGERFSTLDKAGLLAEKVKFDREHDKDKDGYLSGSEILSWLVPSNEEIADEEVVHLFAYSDDDHDDLLSFDEVLEHHEVFVGSEVTDFGDHLHNIHQFQDEL